MTRQGDLAMGRLGEGDLLEGEIEATFRGVKVIVRAGETVNPKYRTKLLQKA